MAKSFDIEAAGGVVVRYSSSKKSAKLGKRSRAKATPSNIELLLVHRPRYDDWSLPKGKLDPGETHKRAAYREVLEETGLSCNLVAKLGPCSYTDHKGRSKRVKYWLMVPEGGRFEPNSEVDRVKWFKPAKARRKLSYDRDRPVIDDALASLGCFDGAEAGY